MGVFYWLLHRDRATAGAEAQRAPNTPMSFVRFLRIGLPVTLCPLAESAMTGWMR